MSVRTGNFLPNNSLFKQNFYTLTFVTTAAGHLSCSSRRIIIVLREIRLFTTRAFYEVRIVVMPLIKARSVVS